MADDINQDKLAGDLLEHFHGVLGATTEKVRADRSFDLARDAIIECMRQLQLSGDPITATGVMLLLYARVNKDSRSMVETMLIHADKRKTEGVWP